MPNELRDELMVLGLLACGLLIGSSGCADTESTATSTGASSSSSAGSGGAGAGGGGGTASSAGGAGQGGAAGVGGSGGASVDCTFDAAAGQSFVESVDPDARVRFFGEATASERLLVEWFGAVPAVGEHVFSDLNYINCETCAFIVTGCTSDYHPDCANFYFATAGKLNVESYAPGTSLKGSLSDVTLIEVTVDWDGDYSSTKVDGGETRCIDDFTIDAPLAL